jgi:hypothetical protein
MRRLLLLTILVGVGLWASAATVALGAHDKSTPVVSGQPDDNDLFVKVAEEHPEFGGMFI